MMITAYTTIHTLPLELPRLAIWIWSTAVMAGQGSMTSVNMMLYYYVIQITSSVIRCMGLVMPTG